MDKEKWYIYNIILLSHTTNEILPFAIAWVDLEGNMLTEISQKRNILYYITYMWNVKKIQQTSDYNKKEGGSYREQTSGYQREGGRGNVTVGEWEAQVFGC